MLDKVSSHATARLFEPKAPVRNDTREEESCLVRFVLGFYFSLFLFFF